MNTLVSPDSLVQEPAGLPAWLATLLAVACGLIAANIYYAQPLVGPISAALGLSPQMAGLVVTMSQIGYGVGLLLVVPLGDLFENRSLVFTILSVVVVALIVAAMSTSAAVFLTAALFIGIGSVAVQVLVPYAAHLVPEAVRGRVVGNILSGLMLGIMMARPAASFTAHLLSWHAVFAISAVVMAGLAIVLRVSMPPRQPAPRPSYGALLMSMARLARDTPVLQRRAFYQACLFGVFSLFWTTVPLLLSHTFHLSQNGIALFALAGVAGAIAAPIAGRFADRGWSKLGTGLAMITAAIGLLLARFGGELGSDAGLAILVLAAILLDFGVTAHFVFGQRAIFMLGAAFRSRLNGLYMAMFFVSGAICSTLGSWSYAKGGWSLSMWISLGLTALAFSVYLTERSPKGKVSN